MTKIKRHLDNGGDPDFVVDDSYKRSAINMGRIQHFINDWSDFNYKHPTNPKELRELNGGLAQATYLLPRSKQRALFRQAGYIESPNDYGLVNKAVNGRHIPTYQIATDDISRDNLLHLGNVLGEEGDGNYFHTPLVHAGRFPIAYYVNPTNGEPYAKAWDLNDYANTSTNVEKKLSAHIQNAGAKILDKVGSPVVVTTGYQKLPDVPEELAEIMYRKHHLVPRESVDFDNEVEGLPQWLLEPVEITADRRHLKNGGKIYIKPSHRGKFTALKERTGHSSTWFKEHGTPAQKKMATFALNAAKWKH